MSLCKANFWHLRGLSYRYFILWFAIPVDRIEFPLDGIKRFDGVINRSRCKDGVGPSSKAFTDQFFESSIKEYGTTGSPTSFRDFLDGEGFKGENFIGNKILKKNLAKKRCG